MALTITAGGTFLHRIKMSCNRDMRTPEISAENHSPIGTKYKMIQRPMMAPIIITIYVPISPIIFGFNL